MLTTHYLDEAARRFGDRVNGVFLTDDWGTQQTLMIRPEYWRKIYKPAYPKMELISGQITEIDAMIAKDGEDKVLY